MPFDQMPPAAPMWFAETQLGPKQSQTSEGYLLARDVPVARIGQQIYHISELPLLQPNQDGFISVMRDEAEVFHPTLIASFTAKPIVLGRPIEDVGPSNWNRLAVGIAQYPRRGPARRERWLHRRL